jgi:hypothetical protein
MGHSPVHS